MNNPLQSIVQAVYPISKNAMGKIMSMTNLVSFSKGDFVTKVGASDGLEYFVLDGICKTFLLNPEGEDTTLSFFMTGSILPPFTTRAMEGRSILNIKALTPCNLATVDALKFEALMIDDMEIRNFGNTVLRNELALKVQKEIALASLPSAQRLELLRTQFPNLENLVPHTDIATYLGITPISLSRLRSKR